MTNPKVSFAVLPTYALSVLSNLLHISKPVKLTIIQIGTADVVKEEEKRDDDSHYFSSYSYNG